MEAEKVIAEIEALEQIFTLPDLRPLQPADIAAINEQHDAKFAENPWFKLWNTYWK